MVFTQKTKLTLQNRNIRKETEKKRTNRFLPNYGNSPNFLDRQVFANSADPDLEEQSDQGLHCLPFRLHLYDMLLYGKGTLFKF